MILLIWRTTVSNTIDIVFASMVLMYVRYVPVIQADLHVHNTFRYMMVFNKRYMHIPRSVLVYMVLIPLVGPPFTDPLAVKLLDNRLYMSLKVWTISNPISPPPNKSHSKYNKWLKTTTLHYHRNRFYTSHVFSWISKELPPFCYSVSGSGTFSHISEHCCSGCRIPSQSKPHFLSHQVWAIWQQCLTFIWQWLQGHPS